MKIISKLLLILSFLLIIFISYLSIFGVETDKFNSQISSKVKDINNNLSVELNKIKLVLDPFNLILNVKTIGSKFKNQNEIIAIESIRTQISLKSYFENKFSIENLEISTNSLEIKNFISFIRTFQNSTELFILEKIIKKGFLIADIKLEFDSEGKIKDNIEVKGFIKDTKLGFLKKYNFKKLNFIFEYKNKDLYLNDISFSLNNLNLLSEYISFKKIEDDFLVNGVIKHNKLNIDEKNFSLFIKPYFPKINFEKLKFSSNNSFSLRLSKKLQINDLAIDSKILIEEFLIINKFDFKNFFPDLKKHINFSDHDVSIKYSKDNLIIDGKGDFLFQDKKDELKYSINRKNNNFDFKTLLKINKNPLKIDLLNYKKNNESEASILLEGSQNNKDDIFIKSFLISEKKNRIKVINLKLNKSFKILKLGSINLDYIDIEKQKNQITLSSKKKKYYLEGSFFNANKLIDDLLFDDNKTNLLNIDTNLKVDIKKIRLDNENNLSNFTGNITFKNKEVVKANLVGKFSDNKKLKFTINSNGNSKITTLFLDNAKPIVKRYKFIKGFDDGILDYYSSKKFGESNSQLKIYDFKLKELPLLTKILTLASLQGIADILSGEGIRFDEFEMSFRNKENLMNINEIYAIGPAISILMDGYIEKNELISLRGTLVPATTINKFIGSLPVLGKILVGSKTGEGVFGVSFKIKGPPKNLETSVNPIKTLTPRFITRTLEKIKKN